MPALDTNQPSTHPDPDPGNDEAALRDSLRRCSPATIEAALGYRRNGDTRLLPAIVIGIVQRFSDPELRPKLDAPDADSLRLIEDLGIDSLTMMEIVMLVEEVTSMSISNEELRYLRSIGDIKTFIDCKARGVPPPTPAPEEASSVDAPPAAHVSEPGKPGSAVAE